jgi:hypothetical protein
MTSTLGAALSTWQSNHFTLYGTNGYTRDEFINCLTEGDYYDEDDGAVVVEGFGEAKLVETNSYGYNVTEGQEIWVIFSLNSRYYRILGVYREDPSNWYINPEFGNIWNNVDTVEEIAHERVLLQSGEMDVFTLGNWEKLIKVVS